jgi:hypothetical protein
MTSKDDIKGLVSLKFLRPCLALLAGAHTDIWLEREALGMSLLLCRGKMFRQGN